MTDHKAAIIVLPTGYDPEGDDAPIKRKPTDQGPCLHREIYIDRERHVLVCRRCDAEVEPFSWVNRLSLDWNWYWTRIEMAKARAEQAERSATRRVKEAERAARVNAAMPMPLGKRLSRTAASIARAQVALGEAFVALADIHDHGRASSLFSHCLDDAAAHIERAKSSHDKMIRDHARP